MYARTKSEIGALEREHGCRYSILLELPYFDPIKMCVIDPMHNLLLGTAKHMVHVWKEKNLLSEKDFEKIQGRVDAIITPTDIGRIPTKIGSGYSGFTAEQWQNWTNLFSLYALKDILQFRDFNCWQLFVKASYLLCSRNISLEELNEADKLIMEFLHTFQSLYGKEFCTINLHLNAHLKQCVADFGPVHSFWCFSFERMNGILGSYLTNCHDISVQIMRRCIDSYSFAIHNWPIEFKSEFTSLISGSLYNKGSLKGTTLQQILCSSPSNLLNEVTALPPISECAFQPHIKERVHMCISRFLLIDPTQFELLTLFNKCSALKIGSFILGSCTSRFSSVSVVKVRLHPTAAEERLAKIQYYVKCSIAYDNTMINLTCHSYLLAAISLFDEHQCKMWFGRPTEVWSGVTSSDVYFIPISYITKRVAYVKTSWKFGTVIGTDSVMIVTPLTH